MASAAGWVSQSEAARQEGVSRQWIHELIQQKRLDVNAKRQVKLSQVTKLRQHGLDPARGNHKGGGQLPDTKSGRGKSKAAPKRTGAARPTTVPPPAPDANVVVRGTFTAVRTRREEQQARLAEIEVRERLGELVEWDKVEALNAATAVMMREALLVIPDRLAAVLAAESDEIRVRALLDAEIRGALELLVTSLVKPV